MSPATRCTCIRMLPALALLVRDPDCPATLLHELKANPRKVTHETQ